MTECWINVWKDGMLSYALPDREAARVNAASAARYGIPYAYRLHVRLK